MKGTHNENENLGGSRPTLRRRVLAGLLMIDPGSTERCGAMKMHYDGCGEWRYITFWELVKNWKLRRVLGWIILTIWGVAFLAAMIVSLGWQSLIVIGAVGTLMLGIELVL